MRRKLKKPFALMLAIFILMTSVGNRELFVSAEETEESEVISETEVQEETFDVVLTAVSNVSESTETVMQETRQTEESTPLETKETIMETLETVMTSDTEEPMEESTEEATEEATEEVTEEATEEETKEEPVEEQILAYEPVNQPNGVEVIAYAQKGVLPDGTYMVVSEVSEGTAAYNNAEQALAHNNVAYDGFKALDITFYNADGQIIEPEAGSVKVQMKLEADLLPENADPDTIAVQHHDTSQGDVQIETVADVMVGTVTVDDAAVAAEFSVESFSTFTITWTNGYSGSWSETYFKITVHYVNTNGDEISEPKHDDMKLRDGTNIQFSALAPTVSGLKYKEARYKNALTGKIVTSLSASSKTEGTYQDRKKYNQVQIFNGTAVEETLKYQTDGNGASASQTQKADIYLVYETDTVTPPSPETLRSLSKSKTVVLNNDGTYDLNLTISGAVGSINNKAKIDVLLIIDRSGSMTWGMQSNVNASSPNRRIDAVATAVKSLTDVFDKNNKNIDAQYSAVAFSNNSKSSIIQGWTSSSASLNQAVSSVSPDGGTNYQKGIALGKTQLLSSRSGAEKIVIFLSDGLPTRREPDKAGEKEGGNGQDDNGGYNIAAAVGEIKGLSANQFYCIGIGPDFQSGSSASTARDNLNSLCTNAGTAAGAVRPSKTAVYTSSSVDTLTKSFAEIAGNATSILCDHVTVTDTLSENVEVLLASNNQPLKLEVTVKDMDEKVLYGPAASVNVKKTDNNDAATISAAYADGQLKMNFPEAYKLEPGWTYQVTTSIQPTEKAYEYYRTHGLSYPNYGDANTGTHSGQSGFYSNTSATVDYSYNGSAMTENYDKPVVQLNPGTLIIEKTVEGLDAANVMNLEDELQFEVTIKGAASEIKLNQFEKQPSSTENKYIYRLEGLSPDTTYSVSERNAEIEGFDLQVTESNVSGTIAKGAAQTASLTNAYVPSDCQLTIKKQVAGSMGNKNTAFAFTLTIEKDGNPYTEDIDGLTKDEQTEGVYTFELKHDGSETVILPYGCTVKLSENEDHQGYVTTYKMNAENAVSAKCLEIPKLTEDTTITFTNTRNIQAPTGLTTNNMSFIIMTAGAVSVIIILFVMYMRRRRF